MVSHSIGDRFEMRVTDSLYWKKQHHDEKSHQHLQTVTIIKSPALLPPKYWSYNMMLQCWLPILATELRSWSLTCKFPSLILENNICWLSIRQIYITNISQLLPTFHISSPTPMNTSMLVTDVRDGLFRWQLLDVGDNIILPTS